VNGSTTLPATHHKAQKSLPDSILDGADLTAAQNLLSQRSLVVTAGQHQARLLPY
jgi:hypothetical protein